MHNALAIIYFKSYNYKALISVKMKQWRSYIGTIGAAAPLGIFFLMFKFILDPLTFRCGGSKHVHYDDNGYYIFYFIRINDSKQQQHKISNKGKKCKHYDVFLWG